MRWTNTPEVQGQMVTVAEDVAKLLARFRKPSAALHCAEKVMYDAVGTEEHAHWMDVRNELASRAASA